MDTLLGGHMRVIEARLIFHIFFSYQNKLIMVSKNTQLLVDLDENIGFFDGWHFTIEPYEYKIAPLC